MYEPVKCVLKYKILFIVFLVLTLSLMALIFSMSHQTSEESDRTSGIFIEKAAYLIYGDVDISPDMLSPVIILVRKTAHISAFAVLSVLTLCTVYYLGKSGMIRKKIGPGINIISALIFTVLYAVSDEIHQYFTGGRSAMISDVIIDSMGAVIGIIFVCGFMCSFIYKNIYARYLIPIISVMICVLIYAGIFYVFYPEVLTMII